MAGHDARVASYIMLKFINVPRVTHSSIKLLDFVGMEMREVNVCIQQYGWMSETVGNMEYTALCHPHSLNTRYMKSN